MPYTFLLLRHDGENLHHARGDRDICLVMAASEKKTEDALACLEPQLVHDRENNVALLFALRGYFCVTAILPVRHNISSCAAHAAVSSETDTALKKASPPASW